MFSCQIRQVDGSSLKLHNIAESKLYPSPNGLTVDWMLDTMLKRLGPGPFKVERISTYIYEIIPTDSPFGAYWPQAVVTAFLKDIGISEVQIDKVMRDE